MGIESYNVLVISKSVRIVKENGCWKLEGSSDYCSSKFNEVLQNMRMKNMYSNEWEFDNCLELQIFQENGCLQGVEIRGCLSYLEEGVTSCYEIIKNIDKWVMPMDVYILNEKIQIANARDLYQHICASYRGNIDIFKKQYNDLKLKVTSGKFYSEVQKRERWYYKLYRKIVK